MTAATPDERPAPGRRRVVWTILGWAQTILLNVVAPIVIYSLLTDRGVGEIPALLLSGVGPALELILTVVRTRRVDEFSIVVLIFLAIGVVTSLLFGDPRLLLVKEAAGTGLFGLVLLASLFARRPLMFYFGRRFATDGTPEGVARWNDMWQYPGFRRVQRVITVVWGLTFVGEAVLRIVLTYLLPIPVMVVINSTVPYVILALLSVGTAIYGRRRRAAAARRREAAEHPQGS